MSVLKQKILDRSVTLGVVGLGYVGLPLAVEKAKAGFHVIGFDVQPQKVDMVNQGHNYIGDVVDSDLKKIVEEGMLRATTDFASVASCDCVCIAVPTPLDAHQQPDISYVRSSAESIMPHMHRDMLVVLESTTYPGTTEEMLRPILEKSGLKCGVDFFLAFSPERVDPGNAIYKTKNTPKVVGGVTPECTDIAATLYEAVLEGLVIFCVLFALSRKRPPRPQGTFLGAFLVLYGIFRFLIEFVREPDAQLGYLWGGWLTMGQLLSVPLILVGAGVLVYALVVKKPQKGLPEMQQSE